MSDERPFIEKLETGDVVPNDQTVTIRVYHAKKRVRGKLLTQCHRCGQYYPEGMEQEHAPKCRLKLIPAKRSKKEWRKRALRKAMREADKAGKLAEFIAKL